MCKEISISAKIQILRILFSEENEEVECFYYLGFDAESSEKQLRKVIDFCENLVYFNKATRLFNFNDDDEIDDFFYSFYEECQDCLYEFAGSENDTEDRYTAVYRFFWDCSNQILDHFKHPQNFEVA